MLSIRLRNALGDIFATPYFSAPVLHQLWKNRAWKIGPLGGVVYIVQKCTLTPTRHHGNCHHISRHGGGLSQAPGICTCGTCVHCSCCTAMLLSLFSVLCDGKRDVDDLLLLPIRLVLLIIEDEYQYIRPRCVRVQAPTWYS